MAPTLALSPFALLSSLLLVSQSNLVLAAPAISTNLPNDYVHMGCYTDNVNSRSLYQKMFQSNTVTEESCISFCSTNGYAYAGVEYANECFCGSYIAASGSKTADAECNMACAGDANELCGGPSRLNIFHDKKDVAAAAGPAHNAGPPGWGFLGCYVDAVGQRTLPVGGQNIQGQMTVAKCTSACKDQGYAFAGVEYSGECYCGATLPDSMLAPDGLAGCNMVCNGNGTEFCGGPNRLDAFGYGKRSTIAPKWDNLGCYNDTVQARGLRYQVQVPGGLQNNTVPNCQNACQAAGYTIAGLEYAQECWCDTQFNNYIGPAKDGNAGCNMACKGDPSTVCGGPDRLNIYRYAAGPSSSTTTTTTTVAPTTTPPVGVTTTVPTTTTTTTTTAVGSTGLPGNWTYQGCWVDGANGRILTGGPGKADMTINTCITYCQGQGYTIAGLEYSTECYCGNAIFNGGKLAAQDTDCNMKCGGDKNQVCGGPSRASLYSSSNNITTYKVPAAKTSNLPGNWKYQGCLQDTPQPRVLQYQIDMPKNLSVNACLGLCSTYGFSAASMEYGQQCFCGDDTDRINANAPYLTGNQCNTPCPAEPEALCGGASAMTYYTWDGLNTWTQASGDAAGIYEFLIGGPIIPLITSVELNGKILFTEKHGAGQYPVANSTGAFEFDPSQVGNFSAAWRELQGVKTNVFCSAGLMLPDKAGRIINLGGWSDESTWGVRLYTPDGFNGTQSKNGWEENYKEVRLLDGRWYPGAVLMANGSILVVGGESGANAPAVPTLEVLPTPAGVTKSLYMKWLDDTDPNNLYPFLFVLPSGNIGVLYYNEARILDKDTFATVKSLPNMPGQVNNFLAGRTYPLEGTSMLLPQSAPYTDPLGVLVCGGSTPYQGIALDNCITIQPEVPGANWTIERMPSRRVISSMVALPDGTYLIMNGAHQGSAGFGLAQDGNHEAVLYDPTKPLNARMTKMANTTLDRLYHNEAILMMDGRVLVSGSDPEDNPQTAKIVHLQEYRVETFTPPYLMGGRAATRPDYKFQTGYDAWNLGYGQSFSIAVNSTVGKISMLAAVSSTHGNSMGQRTIFPSFTCGTGLAGTNSTLAGTNSTLSGAGASNSTSAAYTNICTIQTPPNANIAPPSWHQLFVLDNNGTPSVAQWIRVGGDPGQLGNWPNYPDFTRPGV